MWKHRILVTIVWACAFQTILSAQTPAKVDFGRDVQPLIRQHCIGCHGPTQQMNGFRLDRRKDAMRGGTIAVIAPFNSDGSRLYHKLIGNEFGPQMPPTGPLTQTQINIFKAWLDQGAEWPDEFAGETVPAPPDPRAVRLMDALRDGSKSGFNKLLSQDPKAASLRGNGGSTPLMYAVLYGDLESVRMLLQNGADPNVRNDAGATALLWAAEDLEKTRLLIEKGADVNARSDDGRTALLIAAGKFGSNAVVKLLLDHGADVSTKSPTIYGDTTALVEALRTGNAPLVRMLLDRGANVNTSGPFALVYALQSNCSTCLDLLAQSADKEIIDIAATIMGPPLDDARALKRLLDFGADANAKDSAGHTLLMLAAASDAIPSDSVKSLLDRRAELNARSPDGKTALDFAKQRGSTPVVDLLLKAGANEGTAFPRPALVPKPASSVRDALERSIPLLQRNDATFLQKSGCVSCHNNSVEAMAVAAARKNGIKVDEQLMRKQVLTIATYIETWRERVLQGLGIPGDSDTVSYILLGLAAQNHQPDAATDSLARFVKSQQWPDGSWHIFAHRPPIESSDIEVTAASLRSLQVYAPKAQRTEYEKAVRRAADWLMKAQPKNTEDRAFQLLGLAWARVKPNNEMIRKASRDLIAQQRADGGWSQIPTLESDAYATGQVLVALKEVGVSVTDPAYKRGIQFLLNTQIEDGSWYVQSRAVPLQPFFESGFPYGHDQFVSAAGSNWAAMALALSESRP